jgi:hypothetical protein
MGTWGAGIMDSDLALDVRAEFRERVANGQRREAAARSLVRDWRSGFEDREDGAAMWLALAYAAWEAGSVSGPSSRGKSWTSSACGRTIVATRCGTRRA